MQYLSFYCLLYSFFNFRLDYLRSHTASKYIKYQMYTWYRNTFIIKLTHVFINVLIRLLIMDGATIINGATCVCGSQVTGSQVRRDPVTN